MTDDEIIDIAGQVTRAIVQASLYAAERCEPKAKGIFAMLGDYFRDASVLILIFVPIEVVMPEYVHNEPLNLTVVKWTMGISLGTLIGGILLEYLDNAFQKWGR